MAKLNKAPATKPPIYTHEGARADRITSEQQLRRSVMSCMLWEREFYEDGESIANRITRTIPLVKPAIVSEIAKTARNQMKLRHVPLLITREMARYKEYSPLVAHTLYSVIQRADELAEFLAIYWKDNGKEIPCPFCKERLGRVVSTCEDCCGSGFITRKKQPLSAQVKKGLAAAFHKFTEYDLAKYNRKSEVKLRDVLFLCHAKPLNKAQDKLWKRLINGELQTPDTWETELSAGQDKKKTFERLIRQDKLGALALIRNLRGMKEAGVSETLICDAINKMKTERILPFRFISAAKYAPTFEPELETAMFRCLEGKEKLHGKTAIVIDGSGSMFGIPISEKSEIDRFDAACALAILIREICEKFSVVVFSNYAFIIPARRGFALRDILIKKAEKGATNTQNGINLAASEGYDRIIVVTDEQSHQSIKNPIKDTKAYVVNVANYENGIGYRNGWIHIDGWSENILDFIAESEK